MKKLTPRQRLFVHEYLVDLNGAAAARRVGFSAKTAHVRACKLMKIPAIKRAIEAALAKRQVKLEITSEMWLRELEYIRTSNLTDYLQRDPKTALIRVKPFENFPPGASRALESIEEKLSLDGRSLKVKLHSKLEAAKLIGQHLGFLKDPEVRAPGLERAIYELSEKFMPVVGGPEKTRSDEPK